MAGEKLFQNITGRLVRGDLFVGKEKNYEGQPLVDRSGKPYSKFFITVAVRKDDQSAEPFWQMLQSVGERDFPQGQSRSPGFKNKVQDGDQPHPNSQGLMTPWPAWATGCYIVNLELVNQPIPCVNQNNAPIGDRSQIKIGDYVMVSVGVKGNDQQGMNAGLYLDPSIVKLIGYGEAIVTTPDAATVFGTAAVALPPGASAQPVASAAAMPGHPATMQAIPAAAPLTAAAPAMGAVAAAPAVVAAPGTVPPPTVPGAQLGNPTPPGATSPIAPAGTQPGTAALQPGPTIASPSDSPPGQPFLDPA